MRIALIAPPFIPVPPTTYGGTELFIAQLASGLTRRGHEATVYANGESHGQFKVRWKFREADWPPGRNEPTYLKNLAHHAWATRDALRDCDVLHLNDLLGVFFSADAAAPVVCTLHHPFDPHASSVYRDYPDVRYVGISRDQAQRQSPPNVTIIHHGIPVQDYHLVDQKQSYAAFLGRLVPCKGAHLAIEVAKRTGIPLRIAGEVQPQFQSYWEQQVKPQIDGRFIEYIGEADLALKNDLLGHARALLFPIQWDEPFGLVMLEAMACGTPVLALPGGAVEEVVQPGVSGWVCRDAEDMAAQLTGLRIPAHACRRYVEQHFSLELMVRRYLDLYSRLLDTSDSHRYGPAWLSRHSLSPA